MKSIILTGNTNGIGKAIDEHLTALGYLVIGIDKNGDNKNTINYDLANLSEDSSCKELNHLINSKLNNTKCVALINNAAVQILGNILELSIKDFEQTLKTNLIAPLSLSKMMFKTLEANNGNIINIGSIHSKLTKPEFISYATSKAGLAGLTKSMAVDFGNKVRINMISPAAVETNMLLSGFKNKKDLLKLKGTHPTQSIGTPSEVAQLVSFLIENNINFLNGANIELDGGISSRLHDPV